MPFILHNAPCSPVSPPRSTSFKSANMPRFTSLFKRKDSGLGTSSPSRSFSFRSTSKMAVSNSNSRLNVFNASRTSRPVVPQSNDAFSDSPADPPPTYSAAAPPQPAAGLILGSDPRASSTSNAGPPPADDPFAFLATFDTVFLIDDSGSMAGRSWREVAAALKSITPICTAHDADGIDIYFLNKSDEPEFRQITSPEAVDRIFSRVRPQASTPTGTRLNTILKPYLKDLEKRGDKVKPLNIIVITDGQPSDDPESVIISAAKKLDALEAPPWQVGIQFFQVGKEEGAAEALRDLDDGLVERGGGIRDMVDTVPWSGTNGSGLNGEGIMKVVLGAVNRRLDRKRNSTEWRRR